MNLKRFFFSEQRAFLRRGRGAWTEHLSKIRGFLGEGLRSARSDEPILVLGAGSGLEVPWELAPKGTVAWDADPWSRVRTWFRHGRWVPWVFEDLTGGLVELDNTAQRCIALPVTGRHRDPQKAVARLAGLLPSLNPEGRALRAWINAHRPGTILVANVMGQFGSVARTLIEMNFGFSPWHEDPEVHDPLAEAVDQWTLRAIRAFLATLKESGAELWLVHDRAVFFGDPKLELGTFQPSWRAQLGSSKGILEVMDPLCGLDPLVELGLVEPLRAERWLWPVGSDQLHLMEALHRFCDGHHDGGSWL